ncbi:unnamed protein product [Cyclocybe aegerita]|uniref:IgA peptidase M64-domain-containing protein n=1 Tax=Cyclocybe aegerita TaxID=1973307 RepID=A0A8S0W738_CYCAE|nr:unnamed protein product [Cyclocybe aegerita]
MFLLECLAISTFLLGSLAHIQGDAVHVLNHFLALGHAGTCATSFLSDSDSINHEWRSRLKSQKHSAQRLLKGGAPFADEHLGISVPPPPLEIVPLIVSGPSSNRVDLVFFSDGYTPEERDKFVADALRLAEDVSTNQTFNTVQPLLNFWAAFSPSNESGLGNNGPNDTPFGLYRINTELRGVYYAYAEVGRAACDSLGNQCDYPILLGNDPLYGGLGGEFTVVTASIINGPLVLRHELGHSILDVGEEYDGGQAYFGRNSARDPANIPWTQWLSDPSRANPDGTPRIERSVMPMQAYPWTLLNTTKAWAVQFDSSGLYERYLLQFSLSGIPDKEDLRVEFDGTDLEWEPREDLGADRWFYDFLGDKKLEAGKHKLKFTLLNGALEGKAQLCSTEVLEYGNEEEFVLEPGFYSLYPTYSNLNRTTYRPTNDDCLMRSVITPNFCKVCIETLWIKLLQHVSFVDSIQETCELQADSAALKVLDLVLLPLADLRQRAIAAKESYTIIWQKDGVVLEDFTNKTRIAVDEAGALGTYNIHVKFSTEEVRISDSPTLENNISYEVKTGCN